ncbi:MAG: acyl-ACP--UDP-N-acetylglucosamine O-acyltransferase [Rhodospirillaceae bacterium]
MPEIHSTAVIKPSAQIEDSVSIGPYCVVGDNVSLGAGVNLKSHVVVDGYTTIGEGTVVHPFVSLGLPPQHAEFRGEPSTLVIGMNNSIREHVTMHPGTERGRMTTTVGDNCLFMVGSHVAHDCIIANDVILTNNVALGGHVVVDEFAMIGGLSGIHQYVRVGKHSMIGGCSAVESDVIPYGSVKGNRARLSGLNVIGLRRRGFSREDIRSLRTAYGLLFSQGSNMADRISEVAELFSDHPGVMDVVEFIRADSSRAVCQPLSSNGNGS